MSSINQILDTLIGSVWNGKEMSLVRIYDPRMPHVRNDTSGWITDGFREILREIDLFPGSTRRKIQTKLSGGIQVVYMHWNGKQLPLNELEMINRRYQHGAESIEPAKEGLALAGHIIAKMTGYVRIKHSDDPGYDISNIIVLPVMMGGNKQMKSCINGYI